MPTLTKHISVAGPHGNVERIRISQVDTPQAVEHCLRTAFGLAPNASVLVRDADGCIVPLGAGLLEQEGSTEPGQVVYQVEVVNSHFARTLSLDEAETIQCGTLLKELQNEESVNQSWAEMTRHPGSVSKAAVQIPTADGQFIDKAAIQDEARYWCELAMGCRGPGSLLDVCEQSSQRGSFARSKSRLEEFYEIVPFDTSQWKIDQLYEDWSASGVLRLEVLRERLGNTYRIHLTEEQLLEALHRVSQRFSTCSAVGARDVPRIVFASLWQRLILGAVCRPTVLGGDLEAGMDNSILLIQYTPTWFEDKRVSENEFLFGGRQRDRDCGKSVEKKLRSMLTRWASLEAANKDMVVRLGVKFFLHPLATEDVMSAAKEGTTKIDRYRHQYFVSLEVYALIDKKQTSSSRKFSQVVLDEEAEPPKVGERITRSTMCVVATGNPPTRSKPSSSRDWLLSILDAEQTHKADPLNRFECSTAAAAKVLEAVQDDLRQRRQVREFQADFLLYTIIDRCASELTHIYNAYGYRLRLQARLDSAGIGIPRAYVDEVSKIRLEFQELRQWVGQLKVVVHHLENDCDCEASSADDVPWNFGADARGRQGKSMLLFLRHTQDYILQAEDRLSVLDDLARTFAEDFQLHRNYFMNTTLFCLSFLTAVFLPAQFLAGVYGMNFQRADGTPAMEELRWRHGYLTFWIVAGALMLGVATSVLSVVFLRCELVARCFQRLCCYCCFGSSTSR